MLGIYATPPGYYEVAYPVSGVSELRGWPSTAATDPMPGPNPIAALDGRQAGGKAPSKGKMPENRRRDGEAQWLAIYPMSGTAGE